MILRLMDNRSVKTEFISVYRSIGDTVRPYVQLAREVNERLFSACGSLHRFVLLPCGYACAY